MSDPRFPHPATYEFDDLSLSAVEVVARLEAYVSETRRARMREVVRERTYSIVPVLESIYDRGNVHAVLRSAEALGMQGVHIVDNSPRIKESSRVSQGAEKWLDLMLWESTTDAVRELKRQGYRLLVTHVEDAEPIDAIDFEEPAALVFGNEHEGVSEEMLRAADSRVMVPMHGFTQSFNISVAAALCFYHIRQARIQKMGRHGDLTEDQQTRLLAAYYLRSVGAAEKILGHDET